jgi:hypothetical protein
MKTQSEYRSDIAALMEKVAKKDAVCIAENRDPSEEEVDYRNELLVRVNCQNRPVKWLVNPWWIP